MPQFCVTCNQPGERIYCDGCYAAAVINEEEKILRLLNVCREYRTAMTIAMRQLSSETPAFRVYALLRKGLEAGDKIRWWSDGLRVLDKGGE